MDAETESAEQARDAGARAGGEAAGAGGATGGDLGELMHAAFRRLRRRWSEQLAPLGLTPHQSRALFAVERALDPVGGAGADGVRLKDLAERLRIAPRSATEVVDQLADKRLVERTADPADRRATRIVLTDAGIELRRQVTEVRRAESGDFFGALGPRDRDELARLLGLLSGRS